MTPDQRALTLPDFEQLEKCPDSPALRVVKEVLQLVKRNSSHFLRADLSDYPSPREVLSTIGVLGKARQEIGVEVVAELDKEVIEIALFDPKLTPGTPRDESFSYRVNIFGGKATELYRGSTGYSFAEQIFDRVSPSGDSLVVSDNWAETNLSPEEALVLLADIQELKVPSHRVQWGLRETTASGNPRYIVYNPLTR